MEKLSKNKTKAIEVQGRKQAEALQSLKPNQKLKSIKDLFPKDFLNTEAKIEIDKIKIIEQEIIRDYVIYKTVKK